MNHRLCRCYHSTEKLVDGPGLPCVPHGEAEPKSQQTTRQAVTIVLKVLIQHSEPHQSLQANITSLIRSEWPSHHRATISTQTENLEPTLNLPPTTTDLIYISTTNRFVSFFVFFLSFTAIVLQPLYCDHAFRTSFYPCLAFLLPGLPHPCCIGYLSCAGFAP